MKIIISANSFWNIYNFRLRLIKFLLKKNYKVILVAPYDKYAEVLKNYGFNVIFVKFNSLSKSISETSGLFIEYIKILKKNNPDLIISYTIKPNIFMGLACLLKKKRFIINITGLGSFLMNPSFFAPILKIFYKFIIEKSNFVIFQNKFDQLYFNIKNKKKIILPGLGIKINKNKKIKKKTPFIFLYCGRIIKDKGIKEYLLAAQQIKKIYNKNVNFYICGDFDKYRNEKDIKLIFNSLKKNKIIKHINFKVNPKKYIIRSHCVVLPSYREGTSRILLEAMSFSKPIITTDVPGCNYLVNGKNGYLTKAKDCNSLTNAFKKILNLKYDEYKKMSAESYNYVKSNFDEKKIIHQYFNIIQSVLNARS